MSVSCANILSRGCIRTFFYQHRLSINFQHLPSLCMKRKDEVTVNFKSSPVIQSHSFHTSRQTLDLMEFFDDPKNWGEREVKSGRSWRKDDMRIKSNSDLHKLWYVLLKEKNMLLTMEEEAKQSCEYFPNPERIDKVIESMENLEEVIRERNRAYFLLETGETGERPSVESENQIGLPFRYRKSEHIIPIWMNKSFINEHRRKRDKFASKFIRLLQEKQMDQKFFKERRKRNYVRQLLKRFPDMDMDALKQQFPDIDIEKLKYSMA